MKAVKHVKVYTGNFIIIQRIISELEPLNISFIIKDKSESARLAGYGQTTYGLQELHVDQTQLITTIHLIEKITRSV